MSSKYKITKKKSVWRIITPISAVLLCVLLFVAYTLMANDVANDEDMPEVAAIAFDNNDNLGVQRAVFEQSYLNYLFVGDSRYVGMSACAQQEDVFIAKNGMGYDYLIQQMPTIMNVCNNEVALIIGLGVNDINYNLENYISKINEMADTMDCQIFYMSVNPVDETKGQLSGYSTTNAKIDSFNASMKSRLSNKVIFIDTNSYLKSYGYNTVDGLHYDKSTYETIYKYIKQKIKIKDT